MSAQTIPAQSVGSSAWLAASVAKAIVSEFFLSRDRGCADCSPMFLEDDDAEEKLREIIASALAANIERQRDEARESAEFFESNWRITEKNREAANLSANAALAKLAKCRKALQLIANEGAGNKVLAETKPARIARETLDATK